MKELDFSPEKIASYCKYCKGTRVLDVKGVVNSRPIGNPYIEDEFIEHTVLGMCIECKQAIVARNWCVSYNPADHGREYRTVYPIDEKISRHLRFDTPPEIEISYNEAIKCEENEAWNACAVMIGRVLEAACKDYDSSIKNIGTGIKRMHENGLISDELYEWANELRFLRNIGAHASGESVNPNDARESLDFLQAILETLYHLRPMFQRMKERRKKQ